VFGGYENRFIPLHVYLSRSLDWMYDHLKNGKALPPSQVVRAVPRGGTPGTAPALSETNVPPIQAQPVAADSITFSGFTLHVPD
jgi:hydroxybutyrate-dimer hydrolase